MLKRLIEVALPLKEVSEQSAREKSIREGHISTLHMWWARRPLAACRAAVFASLLPDPDDPKCPEDFGKFVMELLKHERYRPNGNSNGRPSGDTPRNRCLEFIKHLVRWENSNNPEFIVPARKLISAAHKLLHPGAKGAVPKVLDPFAGGGAIPLEALRLGCEARAIDLNPVAHLIELCTLVYPQKYGKSNSRPVPDYIKTLISNNRAKRKAKGETILFEKDGPGLPAADGEIIPDVDISEDEFRENPLAADVKYWGHWVLEQAKREIGRFYPNDADGSVPVAYLWVRVVKCPNPQCDATIPVFSKTWLCVTPRRKVAFRIARDKGKGQWTTYVAENEAINFDPDSGTMKRGQAVCISCQSLANSKYLQKEGLEGRISQQMTCVVTVRRGRSGKSYRSGTDAEMNSFHAAHTALEAYKDKYGIEVVPSEPLKAWSGVFNAPLFGMDKWFKLFNDRQLLALVVFSHYVRAAVERIQLHQHDSEYGKAVGTFLGVAVSRMSNFMSTLCAFNHTGGRGVANTFGRQALRMAWEYAETAPFNPQGANWQSSIEAAIEAIKRLVVGNPAECVRGNAAAIASEDSAFDAVITDPPYYDAVPYSDLSDFYYVWLKRSLRELYPDLFGTPLTPKRQEIVSHLGRNYPGERKTTADYEKGMTLAFSESRRVLDQNGICAVMFAHKTTTAWESLISALTNEGLVVTASWPLHTERSGRLRARSSAALASSVTLVCRKRTDDIGEGLWDDVRKELIEVARERLDYFWSQGIRGADFFISAIGPALSVFGKYRSVTKLDGESVKVGRFLDEVRSLVTNYALAKILKTTHTGTIDPESQFYVVWKWSYGDAKVPADESFKLAQALGMDTETMWDRTGVLERSGENVQGVSVAKRMKIKDLGEPNTNGAPASLIDVLHRLCVFREKGDTEGMAEFLGRSGQGNNSSLWLVAQAISEILPDGDKEKQLMQGLLNQKDNLETAAQGRLF